MIDINDVIDIDVKVINHLGIVAEMCNEIEIANFIDSMIPQTFNNVRKVSIGQAVVAMILIGLGFTQRRLYLAADFLKNKPVDLLIHPSLEASDFNDDIFGRALDAIFEVNPTWIFQSFPNCYLKS